MTSKHLDRAKVYHDAIRKAVLTLWDPIGVGSAVEAQDEYDSYVGQIYKLLLTRSTKKDVFDYLWWLETVHMGLVGDRQATEHFAEQLLQLSQQLAQALDGISQPM
jgi:hypothetical protein